MSLNRVRLARIAHMEEAFDRLSDAVVKLQRDMAEMPNLAKDIHELEGYVKSGHWQRDYTADAQGEIPASFKRGVLSQDSLDDLLRVLDSLRARLAGKKH
ncbi:MAG: DUF4298 domain-containing protein [Bacteroidales bacterium]|nr:DUF4298 domain-containing protein [Bacteroidales bacterium]